MALSPLQRAQILETLVGALLALPSADLTWRASFGRSMFQAWIMAELAKLGIQPGAVQPFNIPKNRGEYLALIAGKAQTLAQNGGLSWRAQFGLSMFQTWLAAEMDKHAGGAPN